MTSQTTIPVGIYWKPGVWDLARSAYIADIDTDADSPDSFVGWLAKVAYRKHVRLARLEAAAGQAAAEWRARVAFPMLVTSSATGQGLGELRGELLARVPVAEPVPDRQELGRMLARSAFAQEAVIAAAEEARRRLGRDLPPPPQKLSNRPPRRRPARWPARTTPAVVSAPPS